MKAVWINVTCVVLTGVFTVGRWLSIDRIPLHPQQPGVVQMSMDDYTKILTEHKEAKRPLNQTYTSVTESDTNVTDWNNSSENSKWGKLVVFMRHGEKMFGWNDVVKKIDSIVKKFGRSKSNFLVAGGVYNLNPKLFETIHSKRDRPLSISGYREAYDLGVLHKQLNLSFKYVYVSNALRCVQTAKALLDGMGSKTPINVEPGLHERHMAQYSDYMSTAELADNGIRVNKSYTSNLTDFVWLNVLANHQRIYSIVSKIVDRHKYEDGNVLIVGHANTGEMNVRLLVGDGIAGRFREATRHICQIPNLAPTVIRRTNVPPFYWERLNITEFPKHQIYDWTCVDNVTRPEDVVHLYANGTWTELPK